MTSRTQYYEEYDHDPIGPKTTEAISKCLVKHPSFAGVLHRVLTHVQMGSPNRILLVMGASGVGKTTLRHAVYNLVAEWAQSIDAEYGPISVSAAPPEGTTFSFRAFYEQVLHAMNEPLVAYKMPPEERLQQRRKRPGARINRSTAGARFALEKALIQKAPTAMLVDEAQHLGRDASEQQCIEHMDVIKSLSDITSTKMIMFGTLQARKLQHLNGQLSRRIKPVTFLPYDLTPTDHQYFWSTHVSICKHSRLPINVGQEHAKYLHQSTHGAVGILSEWLQEAAECAFLNSSNIVEIEHLKETQPPEETIQLILSETYEFENDRSKRRKQIRKSRRTYEKKSRKGRPGRRKQKRRDKAGGIQG